MMFFRFKGFNILRKAVADIYYLFLNLIRAMLRTGISALYEISENPEMVTDT
jgi:hypothetical protein